MERTVNPFSILALIVLLAGGVPVEVLGEDTPPLGYLTTSGTVDLKATSGSISLPNSNYVYFAGDQVVTDPGALSFATLTLRDGAVMIGPNSVASVAGSSGAYRIDVARGEVRIRFGDDTPFEIAGNGIQVRPRTVAQADPSSAQSVDALVRLTSNEEVLVASRQGALEVTAGEGHDGPTAVIASGDSRMLSFADGKLRLAKTPSAQGKALRESRLWRLKPWMGGLLAAGGAGGAIFALTGDDDDDSATASPVQ